MKRFVLCIIIICALGGAWISLHKNGINFSPRISAEVDSVLPVTLDPMPLSNPVVVEEKDSALDFSQIFEKASWPHVQPQKTSPAITGNKKIDEHISLKAQARGYMLRPLAEESQLVLFANKKTQPLVRDAVVRMQLDAAKEGMTITFVSGYRSVDDQRKIFLRKLGTVSEDDILSGKKDNFLNEILTVSSPPGYSKHHTGYAMDIGCGTYDLSNAFMQTPCYAWLSENDFSRARSYGFIPSYPEGEEGQGPNPESWEYVWVPEDALL